MSIEGFNYGLRVKALGFSCSGFSHLGSAFRVVLMFGFRVLPSGNNFET